MNVLLFDGPERIHLLPFTYIRPVAHIRIGIDRLQDKWEAALATAMQPLHARLSSKKIPAAITRNQFICESSICSKCSINRCNRFFSTRARTC